MLLRLTVSEIHTLAELTGANAEPFLGPLSDETKESLSSEGTRSLVARSLTRPVTDGELKLGTEIELVLPLLFAPDVFGTTEGTRMDGSPNVFWFTARQGDGLAIGPYYPGVFELITGTTDMLCALVGETVETSATANLKVRTVGGHASSLRLDRVAETAALDDDPTPLAEIDDRAKAWIGNVFSGTG